jgi:acetyl esterase/lipase
MSIQSLAVQAIVKSLRSTLFIHKTETNTHRINFERLSNITKFPRFVKKEEVKYAGMDCAWFIPDNYTTSRTMLYLHGGGYSVGSYNSHRALIARLARATNSRVLAPNYRLAPEHPAPAAVEDALNAFLQLYQDGYENIFVMGDSAGAGLALALTAQLKKRKLPLPKGLILLSPWTDLTLSGDSIKSKADVDALIAPNLLDVFAQKYIGDMDPKDPMISPLFADFKGFPPTFIHVGGFELLLDDSTRLAAKMNKAGVQVELEVWEGMMHVWHFLGGIMPEANRAIDRIGAFVKNIKVTSNADKLDALEVY